MNVADYTEQDWPGWEVFLRTNREEGERRGERRGRQETLALSVRKALAARGLALGPTEEALLEHAELETLQDYFDRSLTAQTLADVFGPG